MSIIFPEATRVLGNVKIKGVLTLANAASPSLATEVNAASALDLTYFLRPIGLSANPPASGQAPPRLGSVVTLPARGRTELPAFDLRYIYNPQEADSTNNNKAKAMLTLGTTLFFVVRKGLDREVAFAAGQQVEVWKVQMQDQVRLTPDGEYDEFEIGQLALPQAPMTPGTIAA